MSLEKTRWQLNNTSCSPIRRLGCKAKLLYAILPLIPIQHCFVDVFGGAATILLNRPLSQLEVYNDLDENLVNFFRVLQNPELFKKLEHRLQYTLYSHAEFKKAATLIRENNLRDDPVTWAWAYFIMSDQCFSSTLTTWGYQKKQKTGGPLGGGASLFARATARLKEFVARLQNVQIECDQAVNVIERFDRAETVFYCDPPYLMSARKTDNKLYQHEMTKEQHIELLDCLLSCQGAVVLSGYPSELYSEKLKDWDMHTIMSWTTLGNVKNRARQEVVWRNERAIEVSGELNFF